MALEVEDGTGKANADAFVSVADCDAYCMAYGLSPWTDAPASPAEDKEGAIRRATTRLSTGYSWKGARAHGRSQALAWPRSGATDGENDPIADTEIPAELVQACCELAARELANPGSTAPDVTLTERVRRETVGPITTEYASAPVTADAARPVLLVVNDLIGGLLAASANSLVGEAVRG